MKNKKKIALIFTVLVLLILMSINFNVSNYSNTTSVFLLGDAPFTKAAESKLNGLNVNKLLYNKNSERINKSTYSDSLFCDTLKYKSIINIKYFIDDLAISIARFIPLYKPISYDAIIIYEWEAKVKSNKGDFNVINQSSLKIDGNYRMSGLISATNAKKKVMKSLRESVETEIKKEIDHKVYEQIKNYN